MNLLTDSQREYLQLYVLHNCPSLPLAFIDEPILTIDGYPSININGRLIDETTYCNLKEGERIAFALVRDFKELAALDKLSKFRFLLGF